MEEGREHATDRTAVHLVGGVAKVDPGVDPGVGLLRISLGELAEPGALTRYQYTQRLHLTLDDPRDVGSLSVLESLPYLTSLTICARRVRLGTLMRQLPALPVEGLSLSAQNCVWCDLTSLTRHSRLRLLDIHGRVDRRGSHHGKAIPSRNDTISLDGVQGLSLHALAIYHPLIDGVEHLLGSRIERLALWGRGIIDGMPRPETLHDSDALRWGQRSPTGPLTPSGSWTAAAAWHSMRIKVHRHAIYRGNAELSAIASMQELRAISLNFMIGTSSADVGFLDHLPNLDSAILMGFNSEPGTGAGNQCRTYAYLNRDGTEGRTACAHRCRGQCEDVASLSQFYPAWQPDDCFDWGSPYELNGWDWSLPSDDDRPSKRFREGIP